MIILGLYNDLLFAFEENVGKRTIFNMLNEHLYTIYDYPNENQKKMFIKLICGDEYTEYDLIYLVVRKNLFGAWQGGFALTINSFCLGGGYEFRSGDTTVRKILYKDIDEVWTDFTIVTKRDWCFTPNFPFGFEYGMQSKIIRFLNTAKLYF